MLVDMHSHSSGISRCCRITAAEAIKTAKEYGIDALVLTNHYQKCYLEDGDALAFANKYADEFKNARVYAETSDFKLFFGIEVTMELYGGTHILIYGTKEDFVVKYPMIYNMSLEELYNLVKAEGGTLVQAHPFRNGGKLLDTRYLDGVEINCHPIYGNSYSKEMINIAKKKGLYITCGGDYHADTYRPVCGTYLPDGIETEKDIADYLLDNCFTNIRVHEPNDKHYYDYLFTNGLPFKT